MAPVRKSMVWLFFKKSADNKLATCTLCNQQLKYFVSTSNLKQHIIRKHRIQYNQQLQREIRLCTDTETANLPDTEYEHEDEIVTFSVYEDTSSKLEEGNVSKNGLDNVTQSPEIIYEESRSSDEEIEVKTVKSHGQTQLYFPTSRNTMTVSRKNESDCCNNALRIIESMVSNTTMMNKPGGKHDSYGSHVAQELEDMPKDMALYCKKIINEAIYQAQLGNLTPHSKIVNEEDHNNLSIVKLQMP